MMTNDIRKTEVFIVERTNKGLEIIRSADSTIDGVRVVLTRKTNKAGEIRHGVVLENPVCGRHQKVGTFTSITPAFKAYKALCK